MLEVGEKMIKCPIIEKEIDIGECVAVVDASENMVKKDAIPKDFYVVKNWKEICNECKYHNN